MSSYCSRRKKTMRVYLYYEYTLELCLANIHPLLISTWFF